MNEQCKKQCASAKRSAQYRMFPDALQTHRMFPEAPADTCAYFPHSRTAGNVAAPLEKAAAPTWLPRWYQEEREKEKLMYHILEWGCYTSPS